jgi:pimeloyl-ACP methyl ester carboxylesterase
MRHWGKSVATAFPAGPYKTLTGEGQTEPVPWYVIPFDQDGACIAPLTREHLLGVVAANTYTDIFLFSHGWNNDWDTASERYQSFIDGFARLRQQLKLTVTVPYKPLLVGVFWPSIALVMPWERAPKFAGGPPTPSDAEQWRRELQDLGDTVDPSDREALYKLTQTEALDDPAARQLADILTKVTKTFELSDQDLGPGTPDSTAADLLDRARQIPRTAARNDASGQFGFANTVTASPTAAFDLSTLDPRNLVRIATVLQMKDRAARVGARGVHQLLRDILSTGPGPRLHLVGHSYGAIVILSALCYPPTESLPAPVDSMLLLQPAVSQWCFAANVADKGYPGGYRPALDRVRGKIITTFTKQDGPLTRLFHLAVRRARDLGQPNIAPGGTLLPAPPSLYAALGGFGPAGLADEEHQVSRIKPPGEKYDLDATTPKLLALNGDDVIKSHGDISNPETWWALFQQLPPAPPTTS